MKTMICLLLLSSIAFAEKFDPDKYIAEKNAQIADKITRVENNGTDVVVITKIQYLNLQLAKYCIPHGETVFYFDQSFNSVNTVSVEFTTMNDSMEFHKKEIKDLRKCFDDLVKGLKYSSWAKLEIKFY